MNNPTFSSSTGVFSWLSRFINLEKGQTPKSFRLDRMQLLADLAGHPETSAPSIHIAGSKGKGSVTAMIAAVLESAGYRPARYMSPHVSDFRERISLGSSFFDESVYCTAGDELRDIVLQRLPAAKSPLFDPVSGDGEEPTYFELLTLYFFLCARQGSCGALVVETGMGGRLDCTNIVDPLVSVITLIELEHTAFLGKTIAAVAGEKAGIIKSGKPLVLAQQRPEALEVFRKKAGEKQSPLFYFPEIAEIRDRAVHKKGTDFSLVYTKSAFFPAPMTLSIPIPGVIQAENAGLAITALNSAFPEIGEDTIRRGLEHFRIPARFETLAEDPPVIIDGAHTPESAALCACTFSSLYGKEGLLLFGCAADKNAVAMAEALLPHFSGVIITTPGTFKTSDPGRVYETFSHEALTKGRGVTVELIKETGEAIRRILELGRQKGVPVLGTGSFYLASEIRAFFESGKSI